MDPISSFNQVTALLRKQLAERAKTAGTATANKPASDGSQISDARLEDQLLPAMQELREASLDTEHQKLRRFVSLALRREFGSDLENDAGFQTMVEKVTQMMEERPELLKLVRAAE